MGQLSSLGQNAHFATVQVIIQKLPKLILIPIFANAFFWTEKNVHYAEKTVIMTHLTNQKF